MRAVVKYKREDGNTEVRDVPVPEIGPSDVLVKVAYIGICGSDPHMFHNQVSYPMAVPIILGHEFSGTIEKVGSDVKNWKPGDRVTAETHARFCGKCVLCKTNNYRFCRERKGYGFGVDGAFDFERQDKKALALFYLPVDLCPDGKRAPGKCSVGRVEPYRGSRVRQRGQENGAADNESGKKSL